MGKFMIKGAALAVLLLGSRLALAQAQPVYTPPSSKMGAAIAESIKETMIRRGFAANDPRIAATVKAVSDRLPALVTAAGTGSNWVKVLGSVSRLNLYVTAGFAVYGAYKWYMNSDGTITAQQAVTAPGGMGSAISAGQVVYFSDSHGGGEFPTIEEAVMAAAQIVRPTATEIHQIVYSSQTSVRWVAYATGIVPPSTTDVNLFGYSQTYVSQKNAGISCPGNYHINGTQCVANTWSNTYYKPQPINSTAAQPQTAYDNLPSTVKQPDKKLDKEAVAEAANRTWKDAAAQPGYPGVPWSADKPVTPNDTIPYSTQHPDDWPSVPELNSPVPIATPPIQLPESNPDAVQAPSGATKIDLGTDPGIQAPTLEEPPTDLFKPIKDLLQPWLDWQVPAHAGQCPTWHASPVVGGHVFDIDLSYHCTFVEEWREIIVAASLACWVVIAAFIILSA